MKRIPLTLLAVLFLALPVVGQEAPEPLVDLSVTVDNSNTFRRGFRLAAESELSMTVSLTSLVSDRKPTLRVRVMRVDDEGRRTEIRKYRIEFERDVAPTSGELKLDAGLYELDIYVEQSDCVVKLEHKG